MKVRASPVLRWIRWQLRRQTTACCSQRASCRMATVSIVRGLRLTWECNSPAKPSTTANGQWPAYSPQWQTSRHHSSAPRFGQDMDIIRRPANSNGATPASGYIVAKKSTESVRSRPMMTDIIYEWSQITHRSGQTPLAINAVWGDGHATSCTSPAIFNQGPDYWDVANGRAIPASRATTRIFSTSWRRSSLDKFISIAATFPILRA